MGREAESLLLGHEWEGNVRELKNTVKSIIPFKTNDTIEVEDFSTTILGGTRRRENKLVTLEENEMDYILKVLKITGFNITRSAGILGITRARLYRKISQLHLKETAAPGITGAFAPANLP
jgi:DNA-binding NtrC family response regulator